MSTATYPFGADHDDRDRARVSAELSARGDATRPGRRRFVQRLRHPLTRIASDPA